MAVLLSEMKKKEEVLREREEFQRSLMNNAVDGILTIDETGIIQSLNAAALRMFGYSDSEVVGKNVAILMPSPFADEHDSYISRYLRTGEKKIIGIGRESVGMRKNGEIFPLDLAVSEVHNGNRRMFAGFVRDLTERKNAEEVRNHAEKLEEMVRPDALTGLSNRRGLEEALALEVERARRYGFPLCIHMIDLDHFKQVNDMHGHIVGNDVLVRSAKIIQSAMRVSDVTVRYGGEEFCIVLPQTDNSGALACAERIHRQIGEEIYSNLDDKEFRVTCSLGIAEFCPELDDCMTLMKRADQSFYGAKNSGRNRICSVAVNPGPLLKTKK